ncbi:MAG: DoxX family protein [Ferruginibacter sp.]
MKINSIISWILRLIAAIILLQTLYFKFTAQPESVELFTKLGVEPWGRIGTGVIELITSILLLLPSTIAVGALLGIGVMAGAILSHIMVIGIQSQGDGGQLFILALIVLVCCLSLLALEKKQVAVLANKFFKKKMIV